MYLDHFGLRSDPFRLDPNLDFVYVSKSHEETLAHLVYGIEQGEDFVLITGGIGTGKTLALHFLLDQIVSSYRTAFVNVTTISFLELLKMILDDLEVDFERNWDRADLLATLKRYLGTTRKQREKVLVVVDEAQNLDPETLEGLRLLSNLSQPGDQVLQIILVGQPALLSLVDLPELEQLKQRIRVHYQLEELSREEVEEYLDHRMTVSGGDGGVFSEAAIDRINRYSRGIPRLVNQFAGKALLSAFVDESKTVKGPHVELEEIEKTEEAPEIPVVVEPEPEPEPDPIPEVPKRVLKSSPPRAGKPKKKKRAASRKTDSTESTPRKKQPLVEEAMGSIEDVDLDDIRASRHDYMATRKPGGEPQKKTNRNKGLIWAACLIVVIVASLYFTGSLDRLTGNPAGAEEQTPPVTHIQNPPENSGQPAGLGQDLVEEAASQPETQPVDPPVETAIAGGAAVQEESTAAETVTANPVQQEEIPTPAAPKPTVLHVASFRAESQATSLIAKLEAQGVEGFVKDQKANGTTWYRVYLGPFPDAATATSVGQDLKAQKAVMYFRLVDTDL